VSIFLLATTARPAESLPPAVRLTGKFEGIEFEFSPGQEGLARSLAGRFTDHNREFAATIGKRSSDLAKTIPLSPVEMRLNRATYLGRIATLLALEKVTPAQEECYDAFLDNYTLTMALFEQMRESTGAMRQIRRVTIWSREELVRRLTAGETITGFSYDLATKQGNSSFGSHLSGVDDRFKDLAGRRKKLRRDYQMTIGQENGATVHRASVTPRRPPKSAATRQPELTVPFSELFPVVVPEPATATSDAEQAQKLWDGFGDQSLSKILQQIGEMVAKIPTTDSQLGFLVLHETTEVGIVDRYFHGADRRWFCDGVANYVPWRLVRDLHGVTVADAVYNRPEQLARFAAWRDKADLRKWPAAENQSDAEQHTDLNSARYAFAANAVFLMNARVGEDVLPRLFTEIGKTKPAKVSMKTVEKAWKKLTGVSLDVILADAIQPPATAALDNVR
jgi:hypothetical protein